MVGTGQLFRDAAASASTVPTSSGRRRGRMRSTNPAPASASRIARRRPDSPGSTAGSNASTDTSPAPPTRRRSEDHPSSPCPSPRPAAPPVGTGRQDPVAGDETPARTQARTVRQAAMPPAGMGQSASGRVGFHRSGVAEGLIAPHDLRGSSRMNENREGIKARQVQWVEAFDRVDREKTDPISGISTQAARP